MLKSTKIALTTFVDYSDIMLNVLFNTKQPACLPRVVAVYSCKQQRVFHKKIVKIIKQGATWQLPGGTLLDDFHK